MQRIERRAPEDAIGNLRLRDESRDVWQDFTADARSRSSRVERRIDVRVGRKPRKSEAKYTPEERSARRAAALRARNYTAEQLARFGERGGETKARNMTPRDRHTLSIAMTEANRARFANASPEERAAITAPARAAALARRLRAR